MRTQQPRTQTMTVDDAGARFASLVGDVRRHATRVVIEEAGVPVAAIVTAEDLVELARLDERRAECRRVLEAMRAPFRGVSPEEIERETAKAVAEVREEMRAERTAASGQQ